MLQLILHLLQSSLVGDLGWMGFQLATDKTCRVPAVMSAAVLTKKVWTRYAVELNYVQFGSLYACTVPHHHHQSLNREGHWGTTDDFATSFLHFFLFSTAL